MNKIIIFLTIISLFTSCCPFCGETSNENTERRKREYEGEVQAKYIADSHHKEKSKYFDYKVKYGLKSLKFDRTDETEVAGRFFLGCGSVSSYKHTYDEYYFYVVYKEGARLEHVPTHKVYIIETDTVEPCAIKIYPNVHWIEYDKLDKKFWGYEDGYTFKGYNPSNYRAIYTFSDTSVMDNWRIEEYLEGSPYIQLYVPIGTIIEEYQSYE